MVYMPEEGEEGGQGGGRPVRRVGCPAIANQNMGRVDEGRWCAAWLVHAQWSSLAGQRRSRGKPVSHNLFA
eukprot:364787-Chlamydomonas_euryale.AAC.2